MSELRTTSWRSRASSVCACLVLLVGAADTVAPAALAAGTPAGSESKAFSELSQSAQQETTPTQTTATTTATTTNSSSKKTIIIALVAVVALLIAIASVIVRDARRTAPAGDPQLLEARSAHDAAVTLRKRRAKAKAARRSRKRNR